MIDQARLSVIAEELENRAAELRAMIAQPEPDLEFRPEPVEELIPAPVGRPAMTWGAKVSSTFRERVWWIADTITESQGHNFDPNWLMACMAWESAESFSPSKKNMAGSGATGLIQFMPSTALSLDTTTGQLAKMTAEDQLNYVYKYFRDIIGWKGPITTLEDCYMAILWPKAVGKPVSYALFDRSKKPTTYRQNAGLDKNRDGVVTKYEAAAHVREKLDKGLRYAA